MLLMLDYGTFYEFLPTNYLHDPSKAVPLEEVSTGVNYAIIITNKKGKAIPLQTWTGQEVEAPRFQDSRHMKVLRLSALRTGRLYPPGSIPGTHFC
jgi:hypothetical protein